MAETTHTLITDEDTEAFRVALWEGLARHGVNGGDVAERDAFEAVAPRLRARWVAEALEELAKVCVLSGDQLHTFSDAQQHMIRRRAAEYQDGAR